MGWGEGAAGSALLKSTLHSKRRPWSSQINKEALLLSTDHLPETQMYGSNVFAVFSKPPSHSDKIKALSNCQDFQNPEPNLPLHKKVELWAYDRPVAQASPRLEVRVATAVDNWLSRLCAIAGQCPLG